MSDLAQVQAQALHDARRQRDDARRHLADLQVEYDRLRDAILYAQTMGLPGHVSAYLSDALSPARPSDGNPRPRTLGAALAAYEGSQAALSQVMAELRQCRDALQWLADKAARERQSHADVLAVCREVGVTPQEPA